MAPGSQRPHAADPAHPDPGGSIDPGRAPDPGDPGDPGVEDGQRPLRADAERNRRLILDAASAVFAERGLEAGFEEVARRAGVGVGTVYRRFPDRDDLIDALFARRLDELVALTARAGEREDPWEALVWFLEESVAAQSCDRGLSEVLGDGLRGAERLERARERMQPAVGAVVARAQAAGLLRDDVAPLDLAVLSRAVSQIGTEATPDLWRRYLAILLDGLRARPERPTPLPRACPDEAELARVAHKARPGRRR
ncbi:MULTISPECIES: TetR/AcrR family transcriptional regulator [unclassified Nocardioides]|uniref:TetR/AcrR family transcriptional regulator n=1 Tax=unclassified Nocardioides TaxID=2615069 RepID=UPI0009E95CE6|nr:MULTISPECIES: TetR/AcrR family transcriptional regulator [unclassified Nocardioides]